LTFSNHPNNAKNRFLFCIFEAEGDFMLGSWPCHEDYQQQLIVNLSYFVKFTPFTLFEYEHGISKLFILNLDPLKDLIFHRYSYTGRPAENQSEIFRSLILMNDLGLSLDEWLSKLSNNLVLQAACGFIGKLPKVASYYDFISRIINISEKPRLKAKKRKPNKKYGKAKMPPKHSGIVQKLVNQILKGRRLNLRPERLLQEIFAKVSVQPSIDLGLIMQTLSISGDGTCIVTGASPYGVKTCECRSKGIYNCDCPRKFSDPNAAWGWDSHNERYFYGYTGYFISTYNKLDKVDLPLYLRLVDAKRHDSVSAVVALAELRDLYPNLVIDTFISDSASDNYATYELLNEWNIKAVIALNKTNKGNLIYPQCTVNDKGIPICLSGHEMVHWGFCQDRCRIKWRCPQACGKCDPTAACVNCSPSPYGRVVYTKPEWDLRLFTRIPRGSEHFKQVMKKRTAAERVNNRILHNYGLENSKMRGKKRISFFATIAGFNIHLDAQLAKLKSLGLFDFAALFALKAAA
jgi:hypothetical protein